VTQFTKRTYYIEIEKSPIMPLDQGTPPAPIFSPCCLINSHVLPPEVSSRVNIVLRKSSISHGSPAAAARVSRKIFFPVVMIS
jgi:hypothetical protein